MPYCCSRRITEFEGDIEMTSQRESRGRRKQQEVSLFEFNRLSAFERNPAFALEDDGKAGRIVPVIAHAPTAPSANRLGNCRTGPEEGNDVAERIHG